MSVIEKFKDFVVEKFAGYIPNSFISYNERASAATTPSNPLMKSLATLSGKYRIAYAGTKQYISFGERDDIPEVLDKMRMQSPTHSGIVTKKAKMICGSDIGFEKDGGVEFKAFIANCSGRNKNFQQFMNKVSFYYEQYGAVPVLIKWNEKKTKIIMMRALNPNGVRIAEVNEFDEPTKFLVRKTFNKNADSMKGNEVREVMSFQKKSNAKEEIMYIVNPHSPTPIYGTPSYMAAYYFIASDFRFGEHIENSASNGFSPKVVATFIGRNMTEEQKQDEYDKFRANFTGTKGETFMLNWIKRPEEKPSYDVIDIKNLDRTIDVLAKLNDAKILTAHNITSPTLFGVMVSGKLGGTGDELSSSYKIFRATETIPSRNHLVSEIQLLLDNSGYQKNKIVIKDLDIDFDNNTPAMADVNDKIVEK